MKHLVPIAMVTAACAGGPRPTTPTANPTTTSNTTNAVTLRAPLDSLQFYVGSWQCAGTSFAGKDQPKDETWQARVEVEPELDGMSLHVRMIGPGENRTEEHKGYDPATKTWHHVAVTSWGDWAAMVSSGWEGDHMVFTPAGGVVDSHDRATFTKRGEREYSHAVSRVGDHGEDGGKVWEKICRKS